MDLEESGFKVIGVRFSSSCATQHELFVKEHSVRNQTEDKPAGRTLFILNIPPWATEASFKRAFSVIGRVVSVRFQSSLKETETKLNKSGFKIGYVVFEKSADLQKSLKLKLLDNVSSDEQPILSGLKKWMKDYNDDVISEGKLRAHVKEVIARYDKELSKKTKAKLDADDEGWTVITKKSRNPGLSRTENNEIKLNQKNKKSKGLDNFYRFQIRESKMKEIATLRMKHEDDKKKVEAIKKARKFKPY